jgi:hypothetical protein
MIPSSQPPVRTTTSTALGVRSASASCTTEPNIGSIIPNSNGMRVTKFSLYDQSSAAIPRVQHLDRAAIDRRIKESLSAEQN